MLSLDLEILFSGRRLKSSGELISSGFCILGYVTARKNLEGLRVPDTWESGSD
jgi:hypothetical protein